MAHDLEKLDAAITPYLNNLGDRFFRNVTQHARENISADPDDMQTETDIAIEKDIMDFLAAISSYPVLSEESDKLEKSRARFAEAEAYWVVDPIDGTAYFRNLDYGEFGTLLALVVRGEIVAGWAYFPGAVQAEDVLMKSVTENDVFINDAKLAKLLLNASPLGQMGIAKHAFPLTAQERAVLQANKDRLSLAKNHKGHSFLQMARGHLDYFAFVGSYPWDFCVAAKIVHALGGTVYKFGRDHVKQPFRDAAILNHEMVVVMMKEGVDDAACIAPMFVGMNKNIE